MEPFEEMKALDALPALVRETITNNQTWGSVSSIAVGQGLHVDTIGSLANAVKHMLFGLISPSQLIDEMHAMGIPDPKASMIARQLNDAIFKPLHEKMRSESGKPARAPLTDVPAPLGTTPPPPPAPVTPAAPLPPVTTVPTAPVAPTPRPEPVIPPAVYEPPPPRPVREVTSPTPIAPLPAPVPKNYARDPYREPIDEGTPQ